MLGGWESDTKQRPGTRSRQRRPRKNGDKTGGLRHRSPQELGPGQGGSCPCGSGLRPLSGAPGEGS